MVVEECEGTTEEERVVAWLVPLYIMVSTLSLA